MTILDEILDSKRREVAEARHRVTASVMSARAGEAPPTRGFREALRTHPRPRVIAELKRRSPSKGEIRPGADPQEIARAYSEAGAAAISVLTDGPYFGGSLADLEAVRAVTDLPILRKDFVVDPYQIDEARAAGADAVLLIVSALGSETLLCFREHARAQDLDVLVEVHDEAELETAIRIGADLVGINNRDLKTFETDLVHTEDLAPKVPEGTVVVTESGIFSPQDVARLEAAGASAFLVGESLMREDDVAAALRRLRGRS